MKAILVVDIPDDIWTNKEEDLGMYAEVWSKRIDDGWCGEYYIDSLKPIPNKRKTVEENKEFNVDEEEALELIAMTFLDSGWNACIDEILGE